MKVVLLACCCAFLCGASLPAHSQPKELVHRQNSKIPGWCSLKKAEAMMDLIFDVEPDVCVELGVFAGASLFPTAVALQYLDHGVVYGIDAWDRAIAIKYYELGSSHRLWWEQANMEMYYTLCRRMIHLNRLDNCCILLRKTFAHALDEIDIIDILHIDGSHTAEGDFTDVLPYCDKVRSGGYIWFDGWATSPLLYEYLKENFLIRKVINSGQCILLQRVKP